MNVKRTIFLAAALATCGTLLAGATPLRTNDAANHRTVGGDPWIYQVYKELYNRQPTAWELNIHNYNNGSWNNYAELKKYVQDYQSALSSRGLQIVVIKTDDNRSTTGFVMNGKLVGADIVSNSNGQVITIGGGNVITAGGANVITAGGANYRVTSGVAGVNFGSSYTVQSAGTTVIPTSGKGALIIR